MTAVTRHPEAFSDPRRRPASHGWQLLDAAPVDEAVAGQDAVLSTLGVPYSRKPITVYSRGTTHIVQAINVTAYVA